MATTMVDIAQLGMEHPSHDKHHTAPAIEPNLVEELFRYTYFYDINQESEEYQQCVEKASAGGEPTSTPPVLSEGPSPAESFTRQEITTPIDQAKSAPFGNVHVHDEDLGVGRHFSFDDLIDETACGAPIAIKCDRSMPPPAVPVKQEASTATYSPPPVTGLSLSASDSYFPVGEKHANELGRSFSKRGRTDTNNTLGGGLVKKNSKRLKQKEDGYPCEHCHETFDRACDRTKHWQRAHAPKDTLPHSCSLCENEGKVKRFLYPKDVRRHLKQVHKIITKDLAAMLTPSISPTSVKSPKTFGMWALCKTVIGLKKLRISASSSHSNGASEKIIMVSSDQRAFVDVDVTGIKTAAALTESVLSALQGHSSAATARFEAQTYLRKHKVVQLGPKLDAQGMLDLVLKDASSQGQERYIITTSFPQ